MRTLIALALVLAAVSGGQASAHARLIRATPRVGSTNPTPPAELSLFFSETIDLGRSRVSLRGPSGVVATGPMVRDPSDGRIVHAPLREKLTPGRYRVDWSVTSLDTHQTEGDYSFSVAP